MIKFGADIVLKSDGAAITDADIDMLIRKGNQRASEIDARIKADCKHSLADFSVQREPHVALTKAVLLIRAVPR
jgi:hypothetical protein